MTIQTRRAGVRLQTDTLTEEGVFTGYASVWNVVDSYGTVWLPGCFSASLEAHRAAGTRPKGLWQHMAEWPILTWQEFEEDDYGLRCKGQLLLDLEKGRECYTLMKAGEIDGLSVGFEPFEVDDVTPEQAAEFGIDIDPALVREDGTVGLFSRVDLWEVSPVTFNSVPGALVDTVRKAPPAPDFSGLAAALDRRERALKKLRFA